MRARLREEIVVTMSVEEARELRRVGLELPGWTSLMALRAALESVIGAPAGEVDHTTGGDERGL